MLEVCAQSFKAFDPAVDEVVTELKEHNHLRDALLYGSSGRRKEAPMAEGLLWYFPDALAAVANVSKIGNDQHNPGQAMFHNRLKSGDHADCIIRHLAHAGSFDKDGVRETAKVAWRALAMLQKELEEEYNLPLPRNAHY